MSAQDLGTEAEDSSVEQQSKNKTMKVRSIKLGRLSSRRSYARRARVQPDHPSRFHSSSPGGSGESTPIEFPDASPHYMKATSCSQSHAKDIQISRLLIRRQSFKPGKKNLARMYSSKWKRNLTRKQSGVNELKRKLKNSRSIKLAVGLGKWQHQESSPYAKSTSFSNNQNESELNGLDSCTTLPVNKSLRTIKRRLRPVRILSRMPTLKSKRVFMGNLQRATCSSTIKDSKFPEDQLNPHEEISVLRKVCPYSYCSLHGHRNNDSVPPLKRFVSIRRRVLKAQKSCNKEKQPLIMSIHTGNVKRRNKTRKSLQKGDSSAVECETMQEQDTLNNGDNDQDDEKFSSCSPQIDYKPRRNGTAHIADQMQVSDKKYARLWHLIYKHAVSSTQGEGGDKLHSDTVESAERITRSSSTQRKYETYYCVDDENEKAVEIVQKAFDEILLPEIQSFSSEDDITPIGVASGHELLHNSHEENSRGVSEANESSMEMIFPNSDNSNGLEDEKPTSITVAKQSEMKISRSWINLKKVLLLNRFVKALENMRSFNPRKPRFLQSDPYREAEKVNLKHLTMEQGKNAEEWMLDFAIQKVISKLAPAQKQRVALLVKAFETVLPFSEVDTISRSISAIASEVTPVQTIDIKSVQCEAKEDSSVIKSVNRNSCYNEAEMDTNLVEAAERDCTAKENVTTNCGKVENVPVPDVRDCSRDSGLFDSSFNPDSTDTCNDQAQNGTVQECPRNMISTFNSESCPRRSNLNNSDMDAKSPANMSNENLDAPKSLILNRLVKVLEANDSVSSSGTDAPLDESTASGKETTEGPEIHSRIQEGSTTLQESATENRFNEAYDSQSGKQNYTRLWYLIYKHMASGVAEKEGHISTPDVEDDHDPTDGTNSAPREIGALEISLSEKDNNAEEHQIRLDQIEAIKMVEEAIDAIVSDDNPSQDQSLLGADNKVSKKELEDEANISVDRTDHKCDTVSIKTEAVCRSTVGPERKWEESGSLMRKEDEVRENDVKVKPNQQTSRSWSNLKKVILLRRFIKSLEKVRQFKPRDPRYLPVEPEREPEKVQLRHNDIEGRRDAEEWMLDYALQQVVSKLTPARKKKVALLVEAFETVIPTIKT